METSCTEMEADLGFHGDCEGVFFLFISLRSCRNWYCNRPPFTPSCSAPQCTLHNFNYLLISLLLKHVTRLYLPWTRMAERTLLVAAQLSSLFSPAQATSVSLTTTRQNTPLPQFNDAQVLPEHATHSSVIHTPITGTILLRVLHGGLILELVSLSSDISPIRFVFPSSILPAPAIFLWDSHQLHVIAVTVTGSLYRLVIDIGENMQLWRNHVETISFREYLIKNYSGTLDGLVHVQGTHCVVIGQPNGSLLRLDAEYLGEDTGMSKRRPQGVILTWCCRRVD